MFPELGFYSQCGIRPNIVAEKDFLSNLRFLFVFIPDFIVMLSIVFFVFGKLSKVVSISSTSYIPGEIS